MINFEKGYVGIIAAMQSEFMLLKDNIVNPNVEKIFDAYYYVGKIGRVNVVLVSSGVGKVNAATTAAILIDHFGCSLIINTGIAGGIKPTKTRDLIISSGLVYSDVDVTNFGYAYGQIPGMPRLFMVNPDILLVVKRTLAKLNLDFKTGIIATGDTFVSSLDRIKNNTDEILAVEMEGCAVGQVATKAGVDFLVIRFISDVVGEESQIEEYSKFEEEISRESARITLSLFEAL